VDFKLTDCGATGYEISGDGKLGGFFMWCATLNVHVFELDLRVDWVGLSCEFVAG